MLHPMLRIGWRKNGSKIKQLPTGLRPQASAEYNDSSPWLCGFEALWWWLDGSTKTSLATRADEAREALMIVVFNATMMMQRSAATVGHTGTVVAA